jgi:metal-responsive CopG/Arc/MetJ family transcriptional regulator
MQKTIKIAISLPEDMLNAVEKEVKENGESRSQFFRRAVELLLRRKKEQIMSEKYILAYQQIPETIEESKAAYKATSVILSEEPW